MYNCWDKCDEGFHHAPGSREAMGSVERELVKKKTRQETSEGLWTLND